MLRSLPEPPGPETEEDAPAYPDGTDVHDWALTALQWAAAARVDVWNEAEGPAPRAPMDRANVADVLTRYETLVRPTLAKPTEEEENTPPEL